ncbi:peptidoglycan DD-metalloendopeptidase family protein [Nonomuraea sp. NPDC004580]|uniref:peptidoglycan DD-metalloendopeptidase family protein n=1 Tax=Nonomuraea sp. NPDC004580 TaxID=3154552 RepID=UPI0033AA974C
MRPKSKAPIHSPAAPTPASPQNDVHHSAAPTPPAKLPRMNVEPPTLKPTETTPLNHPTRTQGASSRSPHLLTALAKAALLVTLITTSALLPTSATPARASPSAPTWRWPLNGHPRIIRRFAPPPMPWLAGHRGIDLAAPVATPVLAAGPGTIRFAGPIAGKGVVTIDHPNGLRTTYLPVTPSLTRGHPVTPGTEIGVIAAPSKPHCPESCLHWGLIRDAQYLNPLHLLGHAPTRLLPFWDSPDRHHIRANGESTGANHSPLTTSSPATDKQAPATTPAADTPANRAADAWLTAATKTPTDQTTKTPADPTTKTAADPTTKTPADPPARAPADATTRTATDTTAGTGPDAADQNAFTTRSAKGLPSDPQFTTPNPEPIPTLIRAASSPHPAALAIAALLATLLLITLRCRRRRANRPRPRRHTSTRGQHRKSRHDRTRGRRGRTPGHQSR